MIQWYVSRNGNLKGPFSPDQLRKLAASGQLRITDQVRRGEDGKWVEAGAVTGLFSSATSSPKPATTPAPPPQITPVPQSQPAQGIAAGAPPLLADQQGMQVPPQQSQQIQDFQDLQMPGLMDGDSPAGVNVAYQRRRSSSSRSLLKPLIFGLCGAMGGLIGALIFGELIFQIIRPPKLENEPLQMALSSSVTAFPGGSNTIKVKIARAGFKGPVTIEAQDSPFTIRVLSATIDKDKDEGEVEIMATGAAPLGTHEIDLIARANEGDNAYSATGKVKLTVKNVPPVLRITVSPDVTVRQGGKSMFVVNVAQRRLDQPVKLSFDNLPFGIKVPDQTVGNDQKEKKVQLALQADLKARVSKDNIVKVRVTSVAEGKPIQDEVEFKLNIEPQLELQADILFVVDLTGSMQFAINGIKNGISRFATELAKKKLDIRVGLVGYRDIQSDMQEPFVMQIQGDTFTTDYREYAKQVSSTLQARGGGDGPESCFQGLELAAKQAFRPNAQKVLVLVTDADAKLHPGARLKTVFDARKELTLRKIDQIHLVTNQSHFNRQYRHFHKGIQGAYFNIQNARSGNAFADLLPKLSAEISRITYANQPAPPSSKAAPPPATSAVDLPPSEPEGIKSMQSRETYAQKDQFRLLLAVGIWTAIIAAAISVVLLLAQNIYMRRPIMAILTGTAIAVGGGLLVGLIGGAVGQLSFQVTGRNAVMVVLGQILGWSLFGGLIGLGLSFFIPNLKWHRGLLGGWIGGIIGAGAYVALSMVDDMLARWLGAVIVGFFIGLMIALAELAFRRQWLEITFGKRETRTVTLGAVPVVIGGNDRLASVYVRGAPDLALRFRMDQDRILCDDPATGQSAEVQPGFQRELAGVTVRVCSASSAQSIGYALQLSYGKTLELSDGLPLTAEDLPGLEPRGDDGIVAIISRRPADPRMLLLRNRSKQPWSVIEPNGNLRSIAPGQAVELIGDTQFNFGQVHGRLQVNAAAGALA